LNPDAASLDNLRDIVVPPPVPWWPPAPGWWLILATLAVLAGWFAVRRWRRYRAAAYRRAALRELAGATGVATAAEILKRTALAAYPRTQVASLSGSAWCRWLESTAGIPVPGTVAEALAEGVFDQTDGQQVADVKAFAAEWIRTHRCRTEASAAATEQLPQESGFSFGPPATKPN
jgi:hypothetical protein